MGADDFEDALRAENWDQEQWLRTPTFTAQLLSDGTLYLRGPALAEGFSPMEVQALTRFLAEHVVLPPKEPPYNFEGFRPTPADE